MYIHHTGTELSHKRVLRCVPRRQGFCLQFNLNVEASKFFAIGFIEQHVLLTCKNNACREYT